MLKVIGLFLATFLILPAALSQDSILPFSITTTERTENLPEYVFPPASNLYNNNPALKVGWGIDSPLGCAVIDGEVWVIFNAGNQYGTHVRVARYRGTDFEHTARQPDGAIDVESGISTHFCGGMWYDTSGRKLYAPIHCEYDHGISPPAGWTRKKTRLATSTDKGLTWTLEGDILTDHLPGTGDWLKFSGSYFEAGPADFDFYVDQRGGYFYIFTGNAFAPKNGRMNNFLWFNEAARCAITDRMAPGKWHKFCNGTWTEPGLGGKSSRVSMGSYGLYGRVMYSTYLQKYFRIGVRLGIIDRRFTDLGFSDGSLYVSTCDDLAGQRWTAPAKISDTPGNNRFGVTLTDANGFDPLVCDRSLRIYNYWLYNIPSREIDVTLGPGTTPSWPLRYGSYAYEPLPESGDSIVSRKTRIIGSRDRAVVYAGNGWKARSDPKYFRGEAMESSVPGTSVQYSFRGTGIYWRGIADRDCGKADVFLDGKLSETVDCFYPEALPYQFAFTAKGLDPGRKHTISVVVRSDRNPGSSGTTIRHMAFEQTAESYRASADFCSIAGKHNWSYKRWNGKEYSDVPFVDFVTTSAKDDKTGGEKVQKEFANYWGDANACRVGPDYLVAGTDEPIRAWKAPHAGRIRIEGDVSVDCTTAGTVTAMILANASQIWTARALKRGKPVSHDFGVTISTGDILYFTTHRLTGNAPVRVTWDPVITFE